MSAMKDLLSLAESQDPRIRNRIATLPPLQKAVLIEAVVAAEGCQCFAAASLPQPLRHAYRRVQSLPTSRRLALRKDLVMALRRMPAR